MTYYPFYSFSGTVTRGKRIGKSLGFPTANLRLETFPLTCGVYLCAAKITESEAELYGLANIGFEPTFGKQNVITAEVHLFGYEGELYDQTISVSLLYFLRPEIKFDSVGHLKEQVKVDIKRARDLLSSKELIVIAHIENEFKTKFGLPRQSGILEGALSKIVFEKEYRVPEAFREIGQYSHLWLLWQFSGFKDVSWSPTVRPPRIGGNTRIGVFASRSPHRPNPIGLSCVKLVSVDTGTDGVSLIVEGADLMDQTPIYDVKPYLAFTDAHVSATGGYADADGEALEVVFSEKVKNALDADTLVILSRALALDPRPAYQDDPDRTYAMLYGDYTVYFTASENRIQVTDLKRGEDE